MQTIPNPAFAYLSAVAQARCGRGAKADSNVIAKTVVRQMKYLAPSSETALHAYCTGQSKVLNSIPGGLVFPFGVNRSQLNATAAAFLSQISLIEGPPGTGKTQTILAIVANAVLAGKTVAVVSQGNSAVDNVWEKLTECGLGHIMARLGSREAKAKFFKDVPPWPIEAVDDDISPDDLHELRARVDRLIDARTDQAKLEGEIREISVEYERLTEWRAQCNLSSVLSLEKYRLSPKKAADLMAYLSFLQDSKIKLKDRVELLFNFRIFRTKAFAAPEARLAAYFDLQVHFYEKLLKQKRAELAACVQLLQKEDYEQLKERLTNESMRYFKCQLQKRRDNALRFSAIDYRLKFDDFVSRFPVIGSSTHSIVNSIAEGALLDYVIIDEASMQDVVPGFLALGCARNAVIVGDSKQLPHIPESTGLVPPSDAYDCDKHSLLSSCDLVFGDSVPRTLLREHYRCDPRIIEFCNQQFYGGQLIPMSSDSQEDAMRLIVTAKGNHARGNVNQREIETYLKLEEDEEAVDTVKEGRGFIAPYRAQVNFAEGLLARDFVRNTVHKFQGRECDEIVYSTVLDKKASNQDERRQAFVDDPRMVNVAVSRAKRRFTLTTGDGVFSNQEGSIAALIRYIEYYAGERYMSRADVVSVFDLLYSEHDQSLELLKARLCPNDSKYVSEQIAASALRDTIASLERSDVSFHSQVRLIQLVPEQTPGLTDAERRFIRNGSSCDFVLHYTVGKRPFAVVEVDGGYHDKPDQMARDRLKDSILSKCGLRLLRLRTTDSGIEEKMAELIRPGTKASSGLAQ